MSSTEKPSPVVAGWHQLEDFVDELHELARTPIPRDKFYQRLLEGCLTTLAASGGAVWMEKISNGWQLQQQINLSSVLDWDDPQVQTAHLALLRSAAASNAPMMLSPRSGSSELQTNPSDAVVLLGAVHDINQSVPHAVIELFLRPGSSPEVQRGWQELLTTICQIATDYHLVNQLHTLQSEHGLHDQSLALLRRVHGSTDLRRTSFEIANEGRRFLEADRVSVLVRHRRKWRLLAVSGVDQVEKRSDTAKLLVQLAKSSARWGEPLDYSDKLDLMGDENLPPQLTQLVERHIDQTDVRRLVAVPLEFFESTDQEPLLRGSSSRPSAVLIAEQFSSSGVELSRQRVVELAQSCEPALRQAARFDRFPLSTVVWWAERFAQLSVWRALGLTFVMAALATAVWALAYVPYDFEVEAPATLQPLVVRDVFASASGTVVDVNFSHGDQVEKGDVMAVLHDPQLMLEVERVQGEIETVKRRREAIAVTRTDRRMREELQQESLPLSAESQQLAERLSSLERQLGLLANRREALTLRSPIAGQVLTLDVQNLLQQRPVERGQLLFSVAEPEGGWWLQTKVDQGSISHVVAAQQDPHEKLQVRFRLAGDIEHTFDGHVEQVSSVAVLDTDQLDQELPAIELRVAVDDTLLEAARPGMNAQVRIHCGERSLGYVWLHDVWEAVYSWWVF